MNPSAIFYVYLLFRLDGRPCYVGKGKGMRWRHHGKYGRNRHLLNIIKAARAEGRELHRVKVRENMSEPEAFLLERELIAFYGREDIDTGILVNLTDGGDGVAGYKATSETRAKLVLKRRLRPPMSQDTRAKISASSTGRKKTPEQRASLSAAQKGKKRAFGWWSTAEGRAKQKRNNLGGFKVGHHHSDETRAKIKAARAAQTNVGNQFTTGAGISNETRAKLRASTTAVWAKRRAAHGTILEGKAK